MPVPVLAQPGDLPGGDLQARRTRWWCRAGRSRGCVARRDRAASAAPSGSGSTPGSGTSRPHTARSRSPAAPDTSPMTSVTLATSSGSVENLNVSAFHGFTPNCLPRLGDRDVVDLQPVGQQPRRPVRHPQPRRRRRQRRRHDPALVDRPRPARPVLIDQPGQPALGVPGPPPVHRRPRHPDPLGDLGVRHPVRGQQHDPRPLRQPRPHRPRPHQTGSTRS